MLSRAADYAVRAVIYLAGLEVGARVAQQDIAAAIDAPYTFAGKILQRLVAAELVESRRGKGGGFSLTERGRGGSMFDVLVAVDGHPALNDCLSAATRCPRAPHCAAHRVWTVAQSQIIGVLKSARIAALAAETAKLTGCPSAQEAPAPVTWATP